MPWSVLVQAIAIYVITGAVAVPFARIRRVDGRAANDCLLPDSEFLGRGVRTVGSAMDKFFRADGCAASARV